MYGWTISLKNKPGQQRNVSFEKIVTSSKKPNLIETNDETEFVHKNFKRKLELKNVKRHSRFTSKRAVFVEKFVKAMRIHLKIVVSFGNIERNLCRQRPL